MPGFGMDAENNPRKSQLRSRIMGLFACVNHGCSRDCNGGSDGGGDCGIFVAVMVRIFLRPCDYNDLAFQRVAVLFSHPDLMFGLT
ncbi:MAG: hypothetical protein VX386_04930, partial [Pseudomonadota bacterium]|nr:hypothetical protein [Pseudomonadota bacterium]